MSVQPPSWQPPQTWEEWEALVRGSVTRSIDNLNPIINDQREPLGLRMAALQAASTANAVDMVLSLLTGLGHAVAQLQGVVREVLERANLDEAARAEILARVEQLEYATVTEAQAERIKEQITGDLADLMAGRLRGEEGS